MLYVLYGKDAEGGREKLRTFLESLQKKRPDAALLRFDDETFTPSSLDELIHGQGLFSRKSIIVFDHVCILDDNKEAVLDHVKNIGASENVFVLFEGALDKKTLTKLEKHAEKVQGFEIDTTKEERFNVFSMTDALGRRDRKSLWVKYQQAHMHGVADEEIHSILFWQVKAMLLSGSAGSAQEAGLNPFVYKKSLGFLEKFSRDELVKISAALVTLYHEARRGRHELGTALERFILSV